MTNQRLKLYTVTWSTETAGPSPYSNERTEVFFKGCKKAITGNACLGCFNRALWDDDAVKTHDVEDVARNIVKYAPNKYVTIGGGEPTDQIEQLIRLTYLLKSEGFHVMCYTWKDLPAMVRNHTGESDYFLRLLGNIDILVDGIYDPSKRVYKKDLGDGFLNSVGSGNQTVWDVKSYREGDKSLLTGYKMSEIQGIKLDETDALVYSVSDGGLPSKIRMDYYRPSQAMRHVN